MKEINIKYNFEESEIREGMKTCRMSVFNPRFFIESGLLLALVVINIISVILNEAPRTRDYVFIGVLVAVFIFDCVLAYLNFREKVKNAVKSGELNVRTEDGKLCVKTENAEWFIKVLNVAKPYKYDDLKRVKESENIFAVQARSGKLLIIPKRVLNEGDVEFIRNLPAFEGIADDLNKEVSNNTDDNTEENVPRETEELNSNNE